MRAANGYNPLRWDCAATGCYNQILRPKIEVFADCLPGRIAFSDIDASVEVQGYFLFLEFKSGMPSQMSTGQRLYFQRLSGVSNRITAVVAWAHVPTMEVSHVQVFRRGLIGPLEPTDLEALRGRIRNWAASAAARPLLRAVQA